MEMTSLPLLNWEDVTRDRAKFIKELRLAMENIGFLVLTNVPGFEDEVQQRLFREVHGFFDAPDEEKAKADISLSPYFRGWSKVDTDKFAGKYPPSLLAQEAFQYGFEEEPVAPYDARDVPIYKRVFRGPNTWPDEKRFPNFRPSIEELRGKYHRLTHDIGHLVCESIGVEGEQFDEYFHLDDPDLGASLNRNFGTSVIPPEHMENVRNEYAKIKSGKTGTHIDGPPFCALLINDKPGLQVVAGEGKWISAPVTCRTKPGDYPVPVVPGAVIVNSGGLLMHLSRGRVVATLHRVNPFLVPKGEDRISMPFFLMPKMEGEMKPFVSTEDSADVHDTGFNLDRDRGRNAAVNRMGTFPQCTRRWWKEEYKTFREHREGEVEAETDAAYRLAKERANRNRARL